MHRMTLAVATLAGVATAAIPIACAHTLTSSRLTVILADPGSGFATSDNDRVDSVTWLNSSGTMTANLASNATGGPFACDNDPVEFWGQAEGYPDEGQAPLMVTGGEVSSFNSSAAGKAKISTHLKTCAHAALSGQTSTAYTLGASAGDINTVKIVRTFKFDASTPVFSNSGLRAYMPRLPEGIYHYVLVPDSSNTIAVYDADNYSGPGMPSSWNGKWLADDDGAGNGVMIVRSGSSANPAFVVIDSDGFSNSNVSSIGLQQPSAGWQSPVVETEYLCFYDAVSWTSKAQAAGKLPIGCNVK